MLLATFGPACYASAEATAAEGAGKVEMSGKGGGPVVDEPTKVGTDIGVRTPSPGWTKNVLVQYRRWCHTKINTDPHVLSLCLALFVS